MWVLGKEARVSDFFLLNKKKIFCGGGVGGGGIGGAGVGLKACLITGKRIYKSI